MAIGARPGQSERVDAKIAAGLVSMLCDGLAERYGLSRETCRARAGIDERAMSDPEYMVGLPALVELLRFALAQTGDPGFGWALCRTLDLRQQGFWGYALLSSNTLRERLEGHVRYQSLRSPFALTLAEEGGFVSLDIATPVLPDDVRPLLLDWAIGTSLMHLREHLARAAGAASEMQLWLSYSEQPHHRALRELFEGEVVFDAPCVRWRIPARWLGFELPGDPYLGRLARGQLDARLPPSAAVLAERLEEQVRARIAASLDRDASLARIARDLGLGARTLQRQLEALGTSFHALLEDVRRSHALHAVTETEQSVNQLAARLGYADAASFRRAFRRWTGLSPQRYRQVERTSKLKRLTRDARPVTRKVSSKSAS